MAIATALALGVFLAAPCKPDEPAGQTEAKFDVECGWVSVPLDPADPAEQTIRLWSARIKASGAPEQRREPVVYINGGPGIATVDAILPRLATSKTFALLREHRDVILFDQRGSGRSEQALCPALAAQLKAVDDHGLAPDLEERGRRAKFVACRSELEQQGVHLRNYTTSASAADLEAVRAAFRVAHWNIVSVSYGSLVALEAMRRNPAAIRSVVLNSPYPPNSVAWAEQASTAAAGYEAIDRACAAQPACRARFGALVPKLGATLARLEQTPLADGTRKITGRLFAESLWPLAVDSITVGFVPLAIDRAYAGDAAAIKGLVRTFAGGDSFGGYTPAQGIAISCHEGGRTQPHYARARRLYPALVDATPDDSWDLLCAAFRPGYADPAFFAPVASDIPTLLYAGTLDGATPPADAYQAARFLSRATVVEVAGVAHAPMGGDECTRSIARAFLDDPDVSPALTCLAQRPAIEFATAGLEAVFDPAK